MEDQNKNLILATVLSVAVIVVWSYMFPPPPPTENAIPAEAVSEGSVVPVENGPVDSATEATGDDPAADAPRIAIETEHLSGTISLAGGRLDDLSLTQYKDTLEDGADNVMILSPASAANSMYVLLGWGGSGDLPGPKTIWSQIGGDVLSVGKPVTLSWTNDQGLVFNRKIEIDDEYMFTIRDQVENTGAQAANIYSFGVVERNGIPEDLENIFVIHEGVIQMADGILDEIDYDDVSDFTPVDSEGGPAKVTEAEKNGWIGFTDHYWQTILIPEANKPFTAVAKYFPASDLYRTVARKPAISLAPGETTSVDTRLFAGPKEWEVIGNYENKPGPIARLFGSTVIPDTVPVPKFIDSIDWGWFSFLTKPMFAVLHWLNGLIGNMGLAIIGLTIILKALLFPLARKSYISMARMKELQPEMTEIRERSKDDPQRMQKEMMELYKREKVNPAAGCLPILLQIPIFFSLYKVIYVTIELRHAPFFGWIKDLSAPDTSSLFNFFGVLPWAAPEQGTFLALIFIGVLPILLGISMWFQQKLNPAPTDETQAMIFAWMPWVFMFMLGSFASGLVVYWIANNTITFAQQYLIMWGHGHKPDLFGNIKSSFNRNKPDKNEQK